MIDATHLDAETHRGWLYGVLAYRIGAINAGALTTALAESHAGARPPVDEILMQRAQVDPQGHTLVEGLVDYLIKRHGGDAAAALAALDGMSEPADPELETVMAAALTATRPQGSNGTAPSLTQPHAAEPGAPAAQGADAATGAEPPLLGGRYRKLREHARGNLGIVYVAHDLELDREVALKQIQDRHVRRAYMLSLFEVEARVTGGLDHPGIVPVFNVGRDADNRPYYTMRLIRGKSLRDAAKRYHDAEFKGADGGPDATLRGLIQRFVAACYAVAYAHSRGVVHRDLKPANIMLGDFGETMVVDWGIAKPLGFVPETSDTSGGPISATGSGSGHSTTPGVKGTPSYMSPEQARNEPVTPASDIYCLGTTLYAVLTGQPPFPNGTTDEILVAVRAGRFSHPRQVRRDVPRALEAICLKAMALLPHQRFAHVRDMAAELERWLNDEPVRCYREPWPTRLGRWGRRHRQVVGVGATFFTMLALACVPVSLLYVQKSKAMRDKEAALVNLKIVNKDLYEQMQQTERAWKQDARHIYQLRDVLLKQVVYLSESLAHTPGAEPLRLELMNSAVAQFRALWKARPRDTSMKADMARVLWYAANLHRLLESNPSAATALYDEAVELSDQAAKAARTREYERLTGRIHLDRGRFRLLNGNAGLAENDFNRAFDRLPADGAPPVGNAFDERNDRQLEALVWLAQADVRMHQGRADALDSARRAEHFFDTLLRKHGAASIDMYLHAKTLTTLAKLERANPDARAAGKALERAAALVDELATADPANLDLAEARAEILIERMSLEAPGSDPWKQTHASLREHADALAALQAEHPLLPSLRRTLARLLLCSARASRSAGAPDDATTALDRAAALTDPKTLVERATHADITLAAETHAERARLAMARGQAAQAQDAFDAAEALYQQAADLTVDHLPTRAALEAIKRERSAVP